jgi:hypothetical protein
VGFTVTDGEIFGIGRRPALTLDDIVETCRVETQQKIGNVVITLPVTG